MAIDQYQLNVNETVPQNTVLLPCFSAFPQSPSMVYSLWSGAFGAFGYQQVTNATGTQCLQLVVQGPLDHSKRPRYVLGLRVASVSGSLALFVADLREKYFMIFFFHCNYIYYIL